MKALIIDDEPDNQLRQLVQDWFNELTATASLSKGFIENIFLKALPEKSTISFCQPFS